MMHSAETRTQKKEISLIKYSEFVKMDIIGLTLCGEDGQVIVRHIAPGSVAADASHAIRIGDSIEKINGESMVGKNHREVASKLRSIALGSNFQLRLSSCTNNKNCIRYPDVNVNKLQNERKVDRIEVGGLDTEHRLKDRINTFLSEYYGFERDEDLVDLVWQLLKSSFTLVEFNAKMMVKLCILEVPEQICEKMWIEISPQILKVVKNSSY